MSHRPNEQPGPVSDGVDPHLDERLDEALKETFPASDPPAVSLSDDPPKVSRFPEDHPEPVAPAASHRSLIRRVLTGGALAAAGVVVTRMILRRKRPRTLH